MIELQDVGLRYGRGPQVLRDVDFHTARRLVSLSHRAVGCRQDDNPQIAVHVAATDNRIDPAVWPERVSCDTRPAGTAQTPYRHRISGFSFTGSSYDLGERGPCRSASSANVSPIIARM